MFIFSRHGLFCCEVSAEIAGVMNRLKSSDDERIAITIVEVRDKITAVKPEARLVHSRQRAVRIPVVGGFGDPKKALIATEVNVSAGGVDFRIAGGAVERVAVENTGLKVPVFVRLEAGAHADG